MDDQATLALTKSGKPFRMRPHPVDLCASFMMSLIILMGTLCALLFCIWLLYRRDEDRVVVLTNVRTTSASYGTKEDSFETPSDSEVIELVDPTLEALLELTATADFSTVLAAQQAFKGEKESQGGTDQRTPGDDDALDVVPAYERWQLLFAAANRKAYAKQLDFYEIELGAFGGGLAGLDYASRLSTNPLGRHEEKPSREKRLYFSWLMATPLARYEQQLLNQAKITTGGRQIVKFVPQALENRLYAKELEYAQSKGFETVESIAKTVFESQPTSEGYEFRVIRQRYR